MLSKGLTRIISTAASYAARIGSPNTDLVHVLLAMVDESEIQRELRDCGIPYGDLRSALLDHLDDRVPQEPPAGTMTLSPLLTLVMERALREDRAADASGMLAAMWDIEYDTQPDYYAVHLVKSMLRNAQRAKGGTLEQASSTASARAAQAEAFQAPFSIPLIQSHANGCQSLPETLSRFCTDLVEEARRGAIDPVIGRDEQIDRLGEILGRRKKNNPILLGEAGVGKTAIVEALATRIAERAAGPSLETVRLLSLDVSGLIGGTRNRGDLEERLAAIVSELSSNPDYVLFVDEIHVLVGGVSGAADAANLLKPALASGRIRCIGATTHGEYARYFEADPAMARRFQPIAVPEPGRDEAVHIMTRLLPTYAGHHRVLYGSEIPEAAVDLSMRYIIGRHLPDKAIDVLDEAGAIAARRGMEQVSLNLVHEVISRISGVKTRPETGGETAFRDSLSSKVLGQEDACSAIAMAVSRASSGLTKEGRARCSMLFAGPDGSGKRFAAETVALLQGAPVHRFDMSEFRESHTLSRLIGAPPGYVGFGSGGQLTEPARRTPTSVFLFERMDLAHPNVAAIIAQAIETGSVTDSMGREASFAGATLIITAVEADRPLGMGFVTCREGDGEQAFSGDLGSEIVESVDALVRFRPLGKDALQQMAEVRLSHFVSRLKTRGYSVSISGDVAGAVAAGSEGGGRSVERAFRRLVEMPVMNACWPPVRSVHVSTEAGKVLVRAIHPAGQPA